MSGWSEDWYTEYRARMEALRNPAPRLSTPGGHGEEQGCHPADPKSGCPADTSKAGPVRRTGHTGNGQQPRRHSRPEEALQAAIVRAWRPQLVPGARLFATNGELPGGAEQVRRAGRRKAMGYMRGCPDLLARRAGALLWLECKAGYNRQTPEQVQWADWAQRDCGDGYAVVNSVEYAGAVLRIWAMVP